MSLVLFAITFEGAKIVTDNSVNEISAFVLTPIMQSWEHQGPFTALFSPWHEHVFIGGEALSERALK